MTSVKLDWRGWLGRCARCVLAATAIAMLVPPAGAQSAADAGADSRDALFGDGRPAKLADDRSTAVRGFVQTEFARTITEPVHWSKMLTRAEVSARGEAGDNVKWALGARLDYDAVFDVTDYYPPDVRKDQRFRAMLRENYVDVGAGDWDFRLGRQQIVWGEMVGLFFADVVSARDLHEFILPEFEILRIPQWAARAEFSRGDVHAELVWIPVPSYDEVGKPGGEFFPAQPPAPPGYATIYRAETRPERKLANTNAGIRVSTLANGWDLSAFYYGSMDVQTAFRREVVTSVTPGFVYQGQHSRINQYGGTLAKDFDVAVLKAEAVYTRGRQVETLALADTDGLVSQNMVDWVVGLEFLLPVARETRLNLQGFQRIYTNHDPGIIADRIESGYSVYLNGKLSDAFEAQILWISSLNRSDWMVRPRVAWRFARDWRATLGVDVFHGPPDGAFGRYDSNDRVYAELRYSF